MGMFSDLLGKILGHASAPAATSAQPAATPAPSPVIGTVSGGVEPTPTPSNMPTPVDGVPSNPDSTASQSAAPAAAAQPSVDVSAVLGDLAAKNPEHLDWKKSIVDLLKLVGMDSSLSARKELAQELGYTGDEGDSAAMNVWLHKAVLKKISENGGHVPAELLK